MPEREFELYLSVLSRMLRLNEQQKNAISDELRDHMEERFEELVRSGLNRDDAIRQALDEFGDAAGLAVDFTNVSRKRIRRIVMRSTVAVASLVAVCVFFLNDIDPQQPGLPGPAQLVAQNLVAATDAAPAAATEQLNAAAEKSDSEIHKPIDFVVAGEVVAPAFLQEMTSGGFTDVPLEEFCEYVSALHNVSILLDTPALGDEGLTSDMPVTIDLDPFPSLDENNKDKVTEKPEKSNIASTAVSLQQGLDWVTHKYELSWYVEEGIIHITSDVAEEQRQVSRSYFIRQFLIDGFTENSLIESVQLMTSGQWQNIDGLGGTLALVGDVLTIRQNWQTHREIELLLATLLDRKTEAAIQYPDESLRVAKLLEQRV